MTSLHTFEQSFRQRLLDLIYGQWTILGAPFAQNKALDESEVIDPEALVWCSLEFLPTEPRLNESVLEWTAANQHYLVRQRILKRRNRVDPRGLFWEAIDDRAPSTLLEINSPTEPPHGLASPADALEFHRHLQARISPPRQTSGQLGRRQKCPATLLLDARDLIGHDVRHFLLVYLLARPHGARLRDIQAWSGYSYRSLAEAADRWKAGKVVTQETGYCRLKAIEPFRELLQLNGSKIILVDWWSVFETGIRLLHDLAKARQKGFDQESAIVKSLKREAAENLEASAVHFESGDGFSVPYLLAALAGARSYSLSHN